MRLVYFIIIKYKYMDKTEQVVVAEILSAAAGIGGLIGIVAAAPIAAAVAIGAGVAGAFNAYS